MTGRLPQTYHQKLLMLFCKHPHRYRLLGLNVSRFYHFNRPRTKALRASKGIAVLCFQTSALKGGEGSASRPGRLLPPGNTRYPYYRRLGGPQSRSGQVRKISPPPGLDCRTVQPVASRPKYEVKCFTDVLNSCF
jgi:hypothetical protein